MQNIEYKESLVAFVDVMGFKQLLTDTDQNKDKLTQYYSIVKTIADFGQAISDVKIMAISDSIIYGIELSDDNDKNFDLLASLIDSLAEMQIELALRLNIWTRGAISIGNLCMSTKENLIVGEGYVNAFNLERSADFARIVLDPRLLNYFNISPHRLADKLQNKKSAIMDFKITDDFIQIDWFGYGLLPPSNEIKKYIQRQNYFSVFFKDLKKRRGTNHELYIKSQKLLAFLVRSANQHIEKNDYQNSPITKKIIKKLEAYSGEKILP